jgi:hypothetical protein
MKWSSSLATFFGVAVFLSFQSCSCTQQPVSPLINAIKWSVTFGDAGVDGAYSILRASDGHYIVAGTKTVVGQLKQCLIAKLDSQTGAVQWTKEFGGAGDDSISKIIQIPTGYAFLGTTTSFGGTLFYVGTAGFDGKTNWTRFCGNASAGSYPGDLVYDGNNLVLVGSTNNLSPCADVIKMDLYGNILWNKSFTTNSGLRGYSLTTTDDAQYLITGSYASSNGLLGEQGFLCKLNQNGDRVWFKDWGGNNGDAGLSVRRTSDNGFIIAGYTEVSTYRQGYLRKVDATGALQFEKIIGETVVPTAFSDFQQVVQTADGGFIAVGSTKYPTWGGFDFFVVKVDSALNPQWVKNYGTASDDHGTGIVQAQDLGYVICGTGGAPSNQDVVVRKTDPLGNN